MLFCTKTLIWSLTFCSCRLTETFWTMTNARLFSMAWNPATRPSFSCYTRSIAMWYVRWMYWWMCLWEKSKKITQNSSKCCFTLSLRLLCMTSSMLKKGMSLTSQPFLELKNVWTYLSQSLNFNFCKKTLMVLQLKIM